MISAAVKSRSNANIGQLQSVHCVSQQFLNFAGDVTEAWVGDGLHGCDRINCRQLHPGFVNLLHKHVARQHCSDLVFHL